MCLMILDIMIFRFRSPTVREARFYAPSSSARPSLTVGLLTVAYTILCLSFSTILVSFSTGSLMRDRKMIAAITNGL